MSILKAFIDCWVHELDTLPIPENGLAVNWLDFWLNRYQTLVSGVLAIIAGAFALVAAQRSIAYDRLKTETAQEQSRRESVKAIQSVVSYTSRALSSNHIALSMSRYFPVDCIPTGLLDTEPLERILFENLAKHI
jgi:hypothetical protein